MFQSGPPFTTTTVPAISLIEGCPLVRSTLRQLRLSNSVLSLPTTRFIYTIGPSGPVVCLPCWFYGFRPLAPATARFWLHVCTNNFLEHSAALARRSRIASRASPGCSLASSCHPTPTQPPTTPPSILPSQRHFLLAAAAEKPDPGPLLLPPSWPPHQRLRTKPSHRFEAEPAFGSFAPPPRGGDAPFAF